MSNHETSPDLGQNEGFNNIVDGHVLPQPAYQGEFTEGEIVRYYNPSEMTLAEKLYVPEIIKGLMLTGGVFFKNLAQWFVWLSYWVRGKGKGAPTGGVTVFYPEENRDDYSPINRGKHILTMRESGDPQCVACYMCATACPAFCIHIVAGEHADPNIEKYPVSFDIEIDKCVFCGYCEEACPVDAIRLTPEPRMADYQRERMLYDKTYLLSWNPTYVEEEHRYPGGAPRDE
jgi:NADH-quinone oxidoreductase subunit I